MDKNRVKQLLYGAELRILGIIQNAIVQRVMKRKVLVQIREELKKLARSVKLSNEELWELWNRSVEMYVRLSRKAYANLRKVIDEDDRASTVFDVLDRLGLIEELENTKNDVANKVEQRRKEENLKETISEGVFFLCSSHINPAKDHEDHEGKVYVSAHWEERCTDKEEQKKVRAYIRNRNIQTVEYITGPPVYMIFRPNCKHYFVPLSIEETLTHSANSLLRRHGAYMPVPQTMSYEERQYRKYYERLKALMYLKKQRQSKALEVQIRRTRKLVFIWKKKMAQK